MLSFKEFLNEAKLRDVLFIKDDNLKQQFTFTTDFDNAKLIKEVNIRNYNNIPNYEKRIKVNYFNTKDHSITDRIKKRTDLESIGEFNELLKKGLRQLFSTHFKEIDKGKNRYELNFIDNRIHVLIDIDYDNFLNDGVWIITIMSSKSDYKTINKVIDINDENFF